MNSTSRLSARRWKAMIPTNYESADEIAARDAYSLGFGWPNRDAQQLLLAACAPEDLAIAAWRKWCARFDTTTLDRLDLGEARLLAQVSFRLRNFGLREPVLDRAFSMYRHTWIKNQIQLRTTLDALHTLAQAGVSAIALKGLALLAGSYLDVGLRPMFDMDLLVRPQDFRLALSSLTRASWCPTQPINPLDVSATEQSTNYSVQLRRKNIEIDLHWHALRQDSSSALDDVVWDHATTHEINEARVACPDVTEQLLIVCVHGVIWNQVPSILWPADAHRLITSSKPVDWQRLIATAVARRLVLPIYDAVRFLNQVLETDVPQAVIAELGAAPISEFECLEYAAMARGLRKTTISERWAWRYMLQRRRENNLTRSKCTTESRSDFSNVERNEHVDADRLPTRPHRRLAIRAPCVVTATGDTKARTVSLATGESSSSVDDHGLKAADAPSRDLWIVTTCMGRLSFLQRTAPVVLSRPDVHYCLVDYSCPDRCGDWVTNSFPDAITSGRCVVESVPGQALFNKCRAQNAGAYRAIREGAQYLCFLDADTLVDPAFFDWLLPRLEPKRFLIAALDPGGFDIRCLTGLLVVSAPDFLRTDGFDDSFEGWGSEDIEMRLRLHVLHGLAYSDVPTSFAQPLEHDDALRAALYAEKDIERSNQQNFVRLIRKLHNWRNGRCLHIRTAARLFFKAPRRSAQ